MHTLTITLAALLLPLLTIRASPLLSRDVVTVGPDGNVSLLTRWRDTVGTATQVWAHGAAEANAIFQTDRSGPLSNVYRSTLGTEASIPCVPDNQNKCEVAIDGFGTVGEVHYVFESTLGNIKGRSTQIMIGCKCLSEECGVAMLIRPIDIFTEDENGEQVNTGRKTCIYEAVGDSYSDCHTELLRVTYRERSHRPNFLHGTGAFNYSVNDPNYGDTWNATGQRGWEHDCLDTELQGLDVFNSSDLTADDLAFNIHETSPSPPHCIPRSEGVRYLREDDDAGAECVSLYEYAAAAAAHRATQQDEIAIGNVEASYVYPKPELVSNTELALSCSGAALGLLFVWTLFRKQLYKRNATTVYTAWVVIIQVLSFILEALPLHTALGTEIGARNWVSQFASVDGTVALAKGHTTPQGSAQGSVLILTAVLGEVQYSNTRVGLLVGLTVFFDVTVITLVVLTLLRKLRVRHLQKRGVLPERTEKDPEFSSKLPTLRLVPEMLLPGARRRGRKNTSGEVKDDSMDLEATVSDGTITAGTFEMSRRGNREEEREVPEDSLQKTLSEIGTVGGLASALVGDGRVEGKEKEGTHIEQVKDAQATDKPSNGSNNSVSCGEESGASEARCAEAQVGEDGARLSEIGNDETRTNGG